MSELTLRLSPEDVQAIAVATADELERRNGRHEPDEYDELAALADEQEATRT